MDYLISLDNTYYLTDDTTKFGKICKINFPNYLDLLQPSTNSTITANGSIVNTVYQTGRKGKNFSFTIAYWDKNHWTSLKTILDKLMTQSVLFDSVLINSSNMNIIKQNIKGFYNPSIYSAESFNYNFIKNITINLIGV